MADKMIRCPAGYGYDPVKHTGCPWCALLADTQIKGAEMLEVGKTRLVLAPFCGRKYSWADAEN